jgi:hypothetical protein
MARKAADARDLRLAMRFTGCSSGWGGRRGHFYRVREHVTSEVAPQPVGIAS